MTFIGEDSLLLERQGLLGIIAAGVLAAFAGSFLGSRLLKKITVKTVRLIVGVMLMLLAIALGLGIV